jgi:hypothetical protein
MILVISIDLVVSWFSGCVEVHDLLVLCPATNLKRLTCDETCPYSLVNDAGLRPSQTCVMICLLI